MYICDELELSNVVPYNNAKIKIRKNEGLVLITGKNLDSKVSKDIKNGAGKSMLWGALGNLRYGAPPSSSLKNSRQDMLPKKDSSISFKFRDPQGRKIQFIQEQKNYHIYIDGVDQEVKRIPNQMKKMAELFPISEEEFYSYIYLSSIQGQVVHFQSDKPVNRLKFITTIFNLDDYDRMKKYFTQMLGRIKEEQIRFDVIESKLLGVVTSLSRLKWNSNNDVEYKEVISKLDKVADKVNTLNQQKSDALVKEAKYKAILKRLKRLQELKKSIGNADEAKLKQLVKAAVAFEEYSRDLRSYKADKAKIDERLERIGYNGEAVDIAERKSAYLTVKRDLSAQQDKFYELRQRAKTYTNLSERMDEIKEEVTSLGFKSPKDVVVPDNLEEDIETCGTTIRLKKLLDCGDASCPTCQQSVDIKSIAKSVKRAETRLKELKKIRAASELIAEHKKLLKQRGEPVDVSKLQKRITKLTNHLEELETAYHEGVKLNELLETKRNIKKPKEVKATKKPADYYREQLSALREYNSIVEDIGDVDAEKIKKRAKRISDELPQIEAELKKVQGKYKDLFDRKSKMEMTKGEHKVLMRQRAELESELEEVKPILAKRDMYKTLEKAWSAKGMKVIAGNDIASRLEHNLNTYAELLFVEPFKFKAYVNEKGFFCDVHRNNGSKPTDVRQLSGAESDAFKLLFMASIMLMVPSNRRTNFVVLDEPDSHMDGPTRSMYAERFLPFLREIVPHVFVITPKDTSIYQDAETWQVIKEKGVSRLHTGE